MFAVSFTATAGSFQADKPKELFRGPFAQFSFSAGYDVTADGQRFVMFSPEGDEARMARTHVVLVLNWQDELRGEFGGGSASKAR
jgi:hypothetical protein